MFNKAALTTHFLFIYFEPSSSYFLISIYRLYQPFPVSSTATLSNYIEFKARCKISYSLSPPIRISVKF